MEGNSKLGIRPKPISGESLSTYLLRAARANFIPLNLLLKNLKSKYFMTNGYIHMIDLFPSDVIDINILFIKLNIGTGEIYTSCLENFDISEQDRKNALIHKYNLKGIFETRKRKFCELCLKEKKIYKLIWQIKNIDICDVHKVRLLSQCPKCKKDQPYLSENLLNHRCHYCNSTLFKNLISKVDVGSAIEMNRQTLRCENWGYYLSNKELRIPLIKGFTFIQTVACKLHYTLDSNKCKIDIGRDFKSTLRNLLKDEEADKKVTIQRLFQVLEEMSIRLEEFSKIEVPREYIMTLLHGYNEPSGVGPCLTPWCLSKKKKEKMERLTYRLNLKSYKFSSGVYKEIALCSDCFVRHGYNKETGNWEIIKVKRHIPRKLAIKVDIVQEVLQLINDGYSATEIYKMLYIIDYYTVIYIIAYLINQSVVPQNILFEKGISIPGNVINCIKELLKREGNLRDNAKAMFNWSPKELAYFITLKEVQSYLLFESASEKKEVFLKVKKEIDRLIVEDIDISSKTIQEKLGLSKTLAYYNLDKYLQEAKVKQKGLRLKIKEKEYRVIIEDFIEKEYKHLRIIKTTDVYNLIGKNTAWIHKNLLELGNWVTSKVNETNKIIKNDKMKSLKVPIQNSVKNFIKYGKDPTYLKVLSEFGLHPRVFRRYPFLRDFINEAKKIEMKQKSLI